MGGTADKPTPLWMPWREALERAGSLETLRPHLREGHILARYGELRYWPKGGEYSGPGNVKPEWWADAREDTVTGRVIFTAPARYQFFIVGHRPFPPDDRPPLTEEVFAIGIELEGDAVARLFPATVPAARPAEAASTSVASPSEKVPTATVSQSALTDWYTKTYVPDRISAGECPSREQDASAAKDHFKGLNVPRDRLRDLRRDHAPKDWTKPGRPSGD